MRGSIWFSPKGVATESGEARTPPAWRRPFLPVLACLVVVASPAAGGRAGAQVPASVAVEAEASEAFAAARSALRAPEEIKLAVVPEAAARDIEFADGTLRVPAEAVRLARSRAELVGLYVVAIAEAPPPVRGARAKAKHRSAQEWVAGAAVAVLGEALDPLRDGADRNQLRAYDAPARPLPPALPQAGASPRGYAMLAAMGRAGSCSGPTLAYLDRLARTLPSATAAGLARRTRALLGPLAFPPQDVCAAG